MSIEVLKRFQAAEKRKKNWDRTYEEALSYAAPQRESFETHMRSQNRGARRDGFQQVFDSTALMAYQKFASNLQMSLVPPFKKWVNFVPGRLIENPDRPALAKSLEDIRDAFFTYLHMSNFDTQIAESLLDLGLGTGALLVQKGRHGQPLHFTAVPLSQLYLEEGENGTVGSVFRKHKIPARTIQKTWPDAKLNEKLQKLVAEKPDEDVEFIEATVPARIKVRDKNSNTMVDVDGYIYTVVDPKSKHELLRREQRSSPWVVFRYSVFPGEIYGRGPLLLALPDIKTLNKTKELILKNASLAVAGAYTVADDGVINVHNIRIQPGALIPVASNGGGVNGPSIAPLPRSGDFQVGQILLEELRQSVNDMLFASPFGPVDLPNKTATEIAMRQQELSRHIGSAFGRLQFEMLGPLVNRVLHLLEEQGLIDLSHFRVDGGVIAIEHISPLALAQDQTELTNLLRYGETMTQLFGAELGLALTKPHLFAQKVAQLLGVPSDIAPNEEDIEKLQQALGALMQQKDMQQKEVQQLEEGAYESEQTT